jgi:hypothetical protein
MATPTLGGPLNVKGSEALATISDATHTYISAGKQLQLKVTFEEYLYYASVTRAKEKAADKAYQNARGSSTIKSLLFDRFQLKAARSHQQPAQMTQEHGSGHSHDIDEKNIQPSPPIYGSSNTTPTEYPELHTANRALRTAGWGSVFYLITTDILGPSNTP